MSIGASQIILICFFVGLFLALTIWPSVKVLHKAGRSGWWVLPSLLLPFVNVILIWVFAYARWPGVDPQEAFAGAGPAGGPRWPDRDAPRDEPRGPRPPDALDKIGISQSRSPVARLAELDRLQDKGMISSEEHAQKRQEILDEM